MAAEFHPPEKWAAAPEGETRAWLTRAADERDFADAVRTSRLKPFDAEASARQHVDARALIDGLQTAKEDETANAKAAIAAEFPSEFADYHRGALLYEEGKWEEASAAWQELLKRPPEERHYRSVWAAFMLGKAGLKREDPKAPEWFQRTRELAAGGFADALGMAADSYGWEARSEWKQDHPEKAARLYLTQLALGDTSAIVSLKALIPDRWPQDGLLNYGPESEEREKWTPEQTATDQKEAGRKLAAAARDPLLRRLVTLHILASGSGRSRLFPDTKTSGHPRSAHWLKTIEGLKLKEVREAEYLGWIAYESGEYAAAARWLALARPEIPAAAWLRAKLLWREGKTAEAARSMAKAWEPIAIAAERHASQSDLPSEGIYDGRMSFESRAGGDLAAMRLARGDFVQAMEIFRQGGLWADAAYLAERVLTTEELKHSVETAPEKPGSSVESLAYLLGRRLVREGKYAEAAPYLPVPYRKILQAYVDALKIARDARLPKMARAQAWYTAAYLARYDGMELMGTEEAPDVFAFGGDYLMIDIARQRLSGLAREDRWGEDQKAKLRPITLPTTAEEIRRLKAHRIQPDVRFHYRIIAAEHAMEAAKLLPDQSEELADVLNVSGGWLVDRDNKMADRYYQVLEKRAGRTEIGRSAVAKHWFVDQSGDWTREQQQGLENLHQEAGLQR